MKKDTKKIVILASAIIAACSISVAAYMYITGANPIDLSNALQGGISAEQDEEKITPQSLFDEGKYKEAITEIDLEEKISEENATLRQTALNELAIESIDKAWELIYKYDYEGAKTLLEEVKTLGTIENEIFFKLYDTCVTYSVTIPYEGTVEHIFYHPLIAYTEEAFDGDYQEKGFADYFVTVPEFVEITKRMYENDYIFVDIRLLYEKDENGQVVKSELLLPEGKKPLVLSIDDLNFYPYMKGNGMAHGFEFDENGDLYTYRDLDDGTRTYSREEAIVPILEDMMDIYPDLFWGGHKGTLALTGYEGALGFPTDILDAPDYNQVLAQAQAVADKLKETGWNFACHSYGHNSPAKRTTEQMIEDTDKWIREVGAVVGDTDLYIYPFGELIDFDEEKHLHMVDRGFTMFCGVEAKPYMRYYDNWVLQQRRNIDGIAFDANRLDNMIDMTGVIDERRPKYN